MSIDPLPKTVAIFASAFHPHMGGVEEAVRQLAHAYRARGVSAIVVTNRWPRSLPAFEAYEGIPVYRFPLRVPDGSLKAHVNYRLTHAMIRRRLYRILRDQEVDVLHVQCVSANGYYALLAKRRLGLPLITTSQGERTIDASGLYQRSKFMNRVLRRLLLDSDHVTACSRHTLTDLEQYWGRSLGSRGEVVYNGIEAADFERAQPYCHPRPYVLAIGRMVRQKGFDVLLRAVAKANIAPHDVLLAGEGSERPRLESLARDLNLTDRVFFLGRADRPAAVALFCGCSFFVLPSRDEPQGIVNLEAMAAGKPVIAARVGGVPEIVIENETGLLVEPEDSDALARTMQTLAASPSLCRRLGAAGRERARRFCWSAIADRYLEIYRQVTSSSLATAGA